MPDPNTKMNSRVNRTGWMVTSESCMGSREMWMRFRRVRDQTSASRSPIRKCDLAGAVATLGMTAVVIGRLLRVQVLRPLRPGGR